MFPVLGLSLRGSRNADREDGSEALTFAGDRSRGVGTLLILPPIVCGGDPSTARRGTSLPTLSAVLADIGARSESSLLLAISASRDACRASSWALAWGDRGMRTERAEERREGVCLIESSDGSVSSVAAAEASVEVEF